MERSHEFACSLEMVIKRLGLLNRLIEERVSETVGLLRS